jgi:hypothetical protein
MVDEIEPFWLLRFQWLFLKTFVWFNMFPTTLFDPSKALLLHCAPNGLFS